MSALDDIRQRAEAATKGPWEHEPYGGQNQNGDYAGGNIYDGHGETLIMEVSDRDGAFIAHARTDVPRMLGALDAVLTETYASDDGTEWEHNDGCEGEPTCPACWAQDIRRAVNKAISA